MSVFGFSTDSPTGSFLPIIKYDARSGRMFRIDRVDSGNNAFVDNPVDITDTFRAQVDFENLEVGWINFTAGSAPSFAMIKMGAGGELDQPIPPKPTLMHKNGVRMLLKLHKDIANDKPIRELAGVSKAFLGGIEAVYKEYLALRHTQPGKLPVLAFDGKPHPVKTGSGDKSSTNYHPRFRIVGWATRGDLVWAPVNPGTTVPAHANGGNGQVPPATGFQRAAPPPQQPQQPFNDSDFG